MQKKLIAVAVAGALGAPVLAYAQASTVQVFGTLYTEYAQFSPGQYPNGPHTNVDMLQTPGSEIGFKGEEQLGGGMSAWFQCASTADTRGTSQNGWCSRNSAVGLKGGWGNAFIGNWDTPFKRVYGVNRIVNETGAWGDSFLMVGGSTTTDSRQNPGEFIRRQSNSINYDSPNFGGFQLMIGTNASTQSSGQTSGNPTNKPRLWSFGGTYNNGPLNIGLAYETHKDFAPASAAGNAVAIGGFSGTDKAWLGSIGYVYGPVKIGAMYTQQKFEPSPGTDLKVNAWQIAADWTIVGPHGVRAGYTKADDTKGSFAVSQAAGPAGIVGSASTRVANGGAGGTGATLWQISYVNTLSKRTEATIGYARLDNKNNAGYALGGLAQPTSAGTDQHAWGASLRHRF
jgi:predicted porin